MLGAATMRSVGARAGGLVRATVTDPRDAAHTAKFRVVSHASLPASFGTGGLGSGAAMTLSALTDLQCPPGAGQHACQSDVRQGNIYTVLARAAPGAAAAAALARHVGKYPQFTASAQEPAELLWRVFAANFGVVPVLATANVLAFLPALLAARSRPAQLIRAE